MTPTSEEPFFTVVVPTYNRAHKISPTLRSIQAQTFENFECLVVDDGSDDGPELEKVVVGLGDRRFVYIRKSNGGASSARNLGFDIARGSYVALLDSDDIFVPHKLERHAEVLNSCHGDVLVYSKMIVERGISKQWIKPPRGLRATERVDEYVLCTQGTIRTSTMVISSAVARRVRFDETLPSLQDTDFAIRLADANTTIEFIDEPLVIFNDAISQDRVSRNANYRPLLDWLDSLRGSVISERAYWAGRGWQCARIASYTSRLLGTRLYLEALARRPFSLRQALIIGAQIMLPFELYQETANRVVAILGTQHSTPPGQPFRRSE